MLSGYNIRVGRSTAAAGPYLDKEGKDMFQGGGSLFLQTDGKFVGPGHAAILHEEGSGWLSFHFYDASRGGTPTLAVRRLRWTDDGWPAVEPSNSDPN